MPAIEPACCLHHWSLGINPPDFLGAAPGTAPGAAGILGAAFAPGLPGRILPRSLSKLSNWALAAKGKDKRAPRQ